MSIPQHPQDQPPALFMLSSSEHELMSLKTFSSKTTNGKATVSITLETTDMYELARALKSLGEVFEGQKKGLFKDPAET